MNMLQISEILPTAETKRILGTKAETLSNLQPFLKKAKIPSLVYFTVREWRQNGAACIQKINAHIAKSLVAVRSSSLAEDCWNSSNAGAFASLLNIDSSDTSVLSDAINMVIASYGSDADNNQILVQEMVSNVSLSGVLFTRSIDLDAPYYVINYDDNSGQTDTVTGGMGQTLRTVFLYKKFPEGISSVDENLKPVVQAALEIEHLTGHKRLDIEFAVVHGAVYILQARPLVKNEPNNIFPDVQFDQMLNNAYDQVFALQKRQPYLFGDTAILGVMPDANPAELIGIKPRPLAFSLYRHLITDNLFASVRAQYGYKDVGPYPLMVSVLGQPFVDARVSFNSLIPSATNPTTAESVINASLKKLRDNPNLHDKVEFEIIVNCWFSGIDKAMDTRFDFLVEKEKDTFIGLLKNLTCDAILRIDEDILDTEPLKERFDDVVCSDINSLRKAFLLMEDAQRLGAGPFIRLARSGFVAMTILKSLVTEGAITQAELDDFMESLNTVSKQIEASAYDVKSGQKPIGNLVDNYGHLRPGTYDIMSMAYFEDIEKFIIPIVEAATNYKPVQFKWNPQAILNIREVFDGAGLKISISEFETFCRKAIEGREYGKFVYTKNMSYALEFVRKWGEENSLSRDDVSFLTWSSLKDIVLGLSPFNEEIIQEKINSARAEYRLSQAVELPSLITCPEDVFAFERQAADANFITSQSVTSELLVLDIHNFNKQNLAGKIVLIPGADPGYDWLFSQEIGGLITMFGGANSHMAIRSAEQRLPAAIGVGQTIYNTLFTAKTVTLNCESRIIKVIN